MHSETVAVGIDLGTSNCALSCMTEEADGPTTVPIPQLTSWQQADNCPTLASCIYFPTQQEAQGLHASLPWQTDESGITGHFARERGSEAPDRLLHAAKSWLCQGQIDPRQHLLPPAEDMPQEHKLTPWQATCRYLRHLRQTWEQYSQHHLGSLQQQQVVLTVPASFDEAARHLTRDAAEEAGWQEVVLLEEQQAACYHWLAHTPNWREQVQPGDLLLVCDIGGGTSDFSLIAVEEQQGNLQLERISVGEHILLGGDNMDLALAHALAGQLEQEGHKLDPGQRQYLVHAARQGKERLLNDSSLEAFPIALPQRGARLFGRTLKTQLPRKLLEQILFEGFLPLVPSHSQPQRRTAGLQEMGLNYAADPCISKHLAHFLTQSWRNVESSPELKQRLADRCRQHEQGGWLQPTAVLFNGGVFQADALRQRSLELLQHWSQEPLRTLHSPDLDLAVAQGAAAYAWQRLSGQGLRIRAGTSRSYYIGLESSMPAIPGLEPELKAVCVAPQGMEEGSEARLSDQSFGLLLGESVSFRCFSSTVRAGDTMGTVVEQVAELEKTAALETRLTPPEGWQAGEMVPVELHCNVTELGTLELWFHHAGGEHQWSIEFNLRAAEA